MRYFEDFELGTKRLIGKAVVTRDEIVEFATRFDPQPYHVDEEAARASIFGGLTASSTHTFALMAQISHRSGEKLAAVANLGAENLRFPAPLRPDPLRPDDEITMTSECVGLRVSRSRPEVGILSTRVRLANQRGEVVMETTTNVMVSRRQARKAPTSTAG